MYEPDSVKSWGERKWLENIYEAVSLVFPDKGYIPAFNEGLAIAEFAPGLPDIYTLWWQFLMVVPVPPGLYIICFKQQDPEAVKDL